MQTPRLVYKGPTDDTAQTKRVEDQDALEGALAEGWRLRRVLEPEPEPPTPPSVLRTDGPTLAEYLAAGYLMENYPPKGYAARRTDRATGA